MTITEKHIIELKEYENNPRINDAAVQAVAESIKQFGFKVPIVIDKDGVIIAGHTRLKASKLLNLETVPCIVADDLTPEQIKAFRVADNKTAELAEWDFEKLESELAELSEMGFEMDAFGFEPFEDEPTEIVEDEPPEVDEDAEPITQLGDIWQLGRHRLMCGDSTDPLNIDILMQGKNADLVFTDPPYRLETEGGCKGTVGSALRKQGKAIEFISDFQPKNFLNVITDVFDKNRINAYVFCNKDLLPEYLNWSIEKGYSYNVLVWKKPNAIPIGDSHRPDIEYLLLFRKSAIWNNGLKDVNYSRCLEYGRETGLHPTMKPVELIANELKISSNKNGNIVDFFGGSGSTLIACEQLDRTSYTMELDPKYCDVIVKRWETLTGEKAVRL